MLVKITMEQISREWKVIRHAVVHSLPPIAKGAEDRLSNILHSMLMDKMQCWISYKADGSIDAMLVTSVTTDGPSGIRSLLIYCMYGFQAIDNTSWAEGLIVLQRYAKSQDCARIVGYTEVPTIIDLFTRVGADTKYRFISMPV